MQVPGPSGPAEEDELSRPVVNVEELEMPIGELRGDQAGDVAKCAGQIPARASDESQDLPRVAGTELGLDWSGGARLRVELVFLML